MRPMPFSVSSTAFFRIMSLVEQVCSASSDNYPENYRYHLGGVFILRCTLSQPLDILIVILAIVLSILLKQRSNHSLIMGMLLFGGFFKKLNTVFR